MTYQDLLQIVELIKSSSHFGEFHLKAGDLEVDLKRSADGAARVPSPLAPSEAAQIPHQGAPTSTPTARSASEEQTPVTSQRHGHVGGGEIVMEPAALGPGSAPVSTHAPPVGYPPGAVLIKSPMVGSFYRAAEPGTRPFAEVGQRVEANTTVCIIEVMKLMNSITAGRSGVVTHILVEDGEPVEYGQVLIVVDPA